MIDAEEQRLRIAGVRPDPVFLPRWKPEQLERVAIEIAKLERAHAATARRQALRSAVADRPPIRTRAEMRIGPIHVRHDDREVLEPQIVAAAVRGMSRRCGMRLEQEPVSAEFQ
jgi:hypothetical protein